ncbi:hypothetical protein Rsub_10105 [Raphidocelis subcapitata]|uniref:Uncharacterized protein n=1 Tax=Raphidocelis subcapitata TaxID=307507 RepID=A0A2V0PB54_9CHLO|nr:hypothetical protein Rsub_10105 [Raphidocelis subcapitata]|eukprot:GBF97094.1 hypothetical protein Rsub_10105 [Raphidocelis subcapitata]
MRLAALLAVALLAVGAAAFTQPAVPLRPNVTTSYISAPTIAQQTLRAMVNLPSRIIAGNFTVDGPRKATPKEELTTEYVGCLDTVMPPPLNWGPLYCAGREARVEQWWDEVGSLHRHIDIPVQPKVKSDMVLWMFSPMMPQFIEFEGVNWFWYHLWHPYDHIMAANAAGPSSVYLKVPGVYTLIHEHYRNTDAEKGKVEYESDAWFHVEDFVTNWYKKRIVISINALGMQSWTLMVNLKDTEEGLKIDVEQIIGVAAKGYDPTDPSKGMSHEAATLINDNLLWPAMEGWAPGDEFMRSANAITRHVVEEFSMFRFFLPQVWDKYPHLQFLSAVNEATGRVAPTGVDLGLSGVLPSVSGAGLHQAFAPLNRTKVDSPGAVKTVASKLPEAIKLGFKMNVNDNLAKMSSNYNALKGSLSSPKTANRTGLFGR